MSKKKEVDDRFKQFGTVSFTAITKTNDFIDYLKDNKVAKIVYVPQRLVNIVVG